MATGTLRLLEAMRHCCPEAKFYQASSSEMFGDNPENPQSETTALMPASPYACAKVYAHNLVRNYREGYGIHGSCGILFNHESERRGENFVTRKITKWIGEFVKWRNPTNELGQILEDELAKIECLYNIEDTDDENRIYNSLMDKEGFPKLRLGNLDAKRDWGHAEDYVNAMWLMLQKEEADDYVVATGETYSVRDFLDVAFAKVGIDDWSNLVVIDPQFYRPAEVDHLLGIPVKAEDKLGWERKVSFKDLVHRMVDSDCK